MPLYHHTCCPEFRKFLEFWGRSLAENDVMVHWFEAPDPHGMVPIPYPLQYIQGVWEHLWMGRPVTHQATITTHVDPEFRKLDKFSGRSLATNDVMVHW